MWTSFPSVPFLECFLGGCRTYISSEKMGVVLVTEKCLFIREDFVNISNMNILNIKILLYVLLEYTS